MLDLNFVRENLPLVEEKLRQRGMVPAAVLKDFREVDTLRRQAITEAETSKAQRNKASEEIAKLKKAGQDASAAMAQTKELREKISALESLIEGIETRLWEEALTLGPVAAHALSREKTAHKEELDALVEEWARLSEEAEQAASRVP